MTLIIGTLVLQHWTLRNWHQKDLTPKSWVIQNAGFLSLRSPKSPAISASQHLPWKSSNPWCHSAPQSCRGQAINSTWNLKLFKNLKKILDDSKEIKWEKICVNLLFPTVQLLDATSHWLLHELMLETSWLQTSVEMQLRWSGSAWQQPSVMMNSAMQLF